MDNLQVFNYEGDEVRTVQNGGETWWVLKDVCGVLCLADTNKVAERLDEDELTRIKIVSGGQAREMYAITESGLYSVIIRSDKPEAKKFKRWVTHEVLPSIRKHGAYITAPKIEEILANPDIIIELANTLKSEREQRKRLEEDLDLSKEWYSIKRVADINRVSWKTFDWRRLKETGIRMGKPPQKKFDANYGEVNTYHCSVLSAFRFAERSKAPPDFFPVLGRRFTRRMNCRNWVSNETQLMVVALETAMGFPSSEGELPFGSSGFNLLQK